MRREQTWRVADGLVIKPAANAHAEALGQIANLSFRFVSQRDVKYERGLRVETKAFFDADLEVVEVGNLRLVAKRPGFRSRHGIRLLPLEKWKCLCLVET